MGFRRVRGLGVVCRAVLITAALTAFVVLMLPKTAEAQQTESTSITKIQYNQKQVQSTDFVSDTDASTQRRNARKAVGASATAEDGCAVAEAGNAVAEAGCDGQNGGDDEQTTDVTDQTTPETTVPETTGPAEESADAEKGPLVGGTGIGEDRDVKGDVIGTDPATGDPVVGIDTITIETENCKITDQDDLTITLSDQGEAFRLRDGDNVDITLSQNGTITAKGLETLGDSFPQDQRSNPNKLIVPIPVSENDTPGGDVNDTFPVISSTGIGGEGCRAVQASNDGDPTNKDDVVPGTNPGGNLADTGGPLLGFVVAGLLLTGGGLLLGSKMRRG